MMATGADIAGFGSAPGALVEFGVLGPVEVRVAGQVIDAGHAKQRAVLAVLLLDLGRTVAPDLLIDRVWGEQPPASVRSVLSGYLARLRKVIAIEAEPQVKLTRSAGGYLLCAPGGQLDLHRFRRLTADAARPGDHRQAAARLRDALGLWRGPALAGLDGPWLRAMRQTLELERAAAVLELNEVRLRLGEHAALVSELSGQAADSVGNERLIGQLMLALYRSGRQAEALGWFQQTRQQLADELGADPGPELQALHQQILRADPALAASGPAGQRPVRIASVPTMPRQLPAAVADFTGRAAELKTLTRILDQAGAGAAGTVVISAIGGTAGVGKTALALHWAHQIAHRFGDGQLHVDLRGFDPTGTPATAAEAIRGFLDALGVPPERIPHSTDTQAGLYRSLLADKRMLIVLDNARDEQQARPLLPASPSSLVIITSRNQLSGLAAAAGARLISLDVLTHDEAAQMLTARIGDSRASAEPAAVDEITRLCGCLPLALTVAAARAAARPSFSLAALAAELRDSTGRLDALDAGEPTASVRDVFSWSYQQLSPEPARMFRLLGLHPGPDISVAAAASLAAVEEPQARRLLRELARDCLITERAPGRYAFHDLLGAYATAQAQSCDSEAERNEAIARVRDHYLHTAHAAALLLNNLQESVALPAVAPGTVPEECADDQQAMAWFDAEHHVLLAVITLAAGSGAGIHTWQLPHALMPFQARRGHYQEWADIQRTALDIATRRGDTTAQAICSRLLALACSWLGDFDQAHSHAANAIALYQRAGDRLGEARVHHTLSVTAERQKRYADALGHAEQALRIYQAIGHKAGEADTLNGVGWFHALLGDYEQARAFCRRSLTLSAEAGLRRLGAYAWDSLGYAEHHLGNLDEAAACYQRALTIVREADDKYDEAAILTHLGNTWHVVGGLPQARDAWQQALTILDDLQLPDADEVRAKLASTDAANEQPAAHSQLRWLFLGQNFRRSTFPYSRVLSCGTRKTIHAIIRTWLTRA